MSDDWGVPQTAGFNQAYLKKFTPKKIEALRPTPSARPPQSLATVTFTIVLIVALYYLSYRYPLQINSSRTSPTYMDTPMFLQVAKYLILFGLLGSTVLIGVASSQFREKLNTLASPLPAALFSMGVWGGIKGFLVGDFAAAADGALALVAVALLTLAPTWTADGWQLSKVVSVFAVVAILVEVVQVSLFRFQGRLPALAYEESISVRFGSLLDDPNGFALLISLLIPVVYLRWKRHPAARASLVLALIGCLALSQSATGVASTSAALIVGTLALRWKNPGAILLAVIAVPLTIVIAWQAILSSALVSSVWESKSGSIGARSGSFEELQALSFIDYMGGGTPENFIELSYVSILAHYGVLFLIGYVVAGIVAIRRLRKAILSGHASPMHYGFYYFTIAFLIGSFNLQLDGVWPLNVLYFTGIAFSYFLAANSPPAVRAVKIK